MFTCLQYIQFSHDKPTMLRVDDGFGFGRLKASEGWLFFLNDPCQNLATVVLRRGSVNLEDRRTIPAARAL